MKGNAMPHEPDPETQMEHLREMIEECERALQELKDLEQRCLRALDDRSLRDPSSRSFPTAAEPQNQ